MADFDPHVPLPDELRELFVSLAACRDAGCQVPSSHPHYLGEDGAGRPCAPVVPTRVARGGVMILGAYPNTRYRTHAGDKFVPVADIDEPFEDSAYFDGQGIRHHLSGDLLESVYLRPLGLTRSDVYVTNVVKCFLFRSHDVRSYRRHGFPGAERLAPTRANYLAVAARCHQLWLARELALCRPRLIIGLGGEVRQVIHARGGRLGDRAGIADIGGVLLPAGRRGHESDTRDEAGPFFHVNVMHLYHPGALLRDETGAIERRHGQHLRALLEALGRLGLGAAQPPAAEAAGLAGVIAAFRGRLANEPQAADEAGGP